MKNNGEVKLEFMEAYFKGLNNKITFLKELFDDGHKEEALLLCCCYIEGLGNQLYWPTDGSCRNFVYILKEHSIKKILWHIHPKQLQIGLSEARNSRVREIGKKLEAILIEARKANVLYPEKEILLLSETVLKVDELEKLSQNLWRGTIAAIAYDRIRSELVHRLGAVDVSFSNMTFEGHALPNIDFELLYSPLMHVFVYVKELSLSSGKWFGHDFDQA